MPSARLPELAALDRLFGIEGAEGRAQPRELRDAEIVSGVIVAEFVDKSGRDQYLVESDRGDLVAIPREARAEFSKGDQIEATRTGSSYEIALENDYGI